MKKHLMSVALIGMLVSCGSTKSIVQTTPVTPQQSAPSTNPFGGETFSVPTFEPDTEEYFAATGIARGSRERLDMLQKLALNDAQSNVRAKMAHAYEGMVSDYSKAEGNNSGTDLTNKIQEGGNKIIKVIVNETMARDVKFSGVDEKGYVNCYVGIRVYKQQAARKIANALSEDESLKLSNDEEKFRKFMEEKFKEYRENNK